MAAYGSIYDAKQRGESPSSVTCLMESAVGYNPKENVAMDWLIMITEDNSVLESSNSRTRRSRLSLILRGRRRRLF